eukprot:11845317-Prorocentrum_lima.AAC.1
MGTHKKSSQRRMCGPIGRRVPGLEELGTSQVKGNNKWDPTYQGSSKPWTSSTARNPHASA